MTVPVCLFISDLYHVWEGIPTLSDIAHMGFGIPNRYIGGGYLFGDTEEQHGTTVEKAIEKAMKEAIPDFLMIAPLSRDDRWLSTVEKYVSVVPVYMVWTDTIVPYDIECLRKYIGSGSFQLLYYDRIEDGRRICDLIDNYDTTCARWLFNDMATKGSYTPSAYKSYDVVVPGSGAKTHEAYKLRDQAHDVLSAAKINTVRIGGRADGYVPSAIYSHYINQAKMCVSIKYRPYFMTAHIFEALATESLLLHWSPEGCNDIEDILTPDIHYVRFKDKTDLVDKVKYYLSNEKERKSITTQAKKLYDKKYALCPMWKTFRDLWERHNAHSLHR